jgi:SET domain
MIRDVEVRPAGSKGLGVFALRSFARGEFIFRRRHGGTIGRDDLAHLSEEDRRHLCEVEIDKWAILLPPGCYLNHSCEPNAMRAGVKVFAWRPIRAGEEVTVDYRINAYDDADAWSCDCGTASCSGRVVGSFFSLQPEVQAAYLKFAPAFIRRERARRSAGAPRTP